MGVMLTELTKQLDSRCVKNYKTRYKLPCGFKLDLSIPSLRLGVIIGESNADKTPPATWCVICVSDNGVKSGNAADRLEDLVKARKLDDSVNKG